MILKVTNAITMGRRRRLKNMILSQLRIGERLKTSAVQLSANSAVYKGTTLWFVCSSGKKHNFRTCGEGRAQWSQLRQGCHRLATAPSSTQVMQSFVFGAMCINRLINYHSSGTFPGKTHSWALWFFQAMDLWPKTFESFTQSWLWGRRWKKKSDALNKEKRGPWR